MKEKNNIKELKKIKNIKIKNCNEAVYLLCNVINECNERMFYYLLEIEYLKNEK